MSDLIHLPVIIQKYENILKNSHSDWEHKALKLNSLEISESILGLKLSMCCDESTM